MIALPVMEHFYTIQGEGFHQGRAAYFIRLGGCDVGCVWCDVKDSWDASKHPQIAIETLIQEVKKTAAELVYNRIDSNLPLLGMQSFDKNKNHNIIKKDIITAKNYLNESEIKIL